MVPEAPKTEPRHTPDPHPHKSAWDFFTRESSHQEKERTADIVIYGFISAPSLLLALIGNADVYQIIGGNTGVSRATLITTLLEADSVFGAFVAAVFVIRYELSKMWTETEKNKPPQIEAT